MFLTDDKLLVRTKKCHSILTSIFLLNSTFVLLWNELRYVLRILEFEIICAESWQPSTGSYVGLSSYLSGHLKAVSWVFFKSPFILLSFEMSFWLYTHLLSFAHLKRIDQIFQAYLEGTKRCLSRPHHFSRVFYFKKCQFIESNKVHCVKYFFPLPETEQVVCPNNVLSKLVCLSFEIRFERKDSFFQISFFRISKERFEGKKMISNLIFVRLG